MIVWGGVFEKFSTVSRFSIRVRARPSNSTLNRFVSTEIFRPWMSRWVRPGERAHAKDRWKDRAEVKHRIWIS